MTILLSSCIYGKCHLAVLCGCEFSLDNKMSEYEMHLADKASVVMENLSVNYIAIYFMLHISLVALFQYCFCRLLSILCFKAVFYMSEMTKNLGETVTEESILGKYMVGLLFPEGPLLCCCEKHDVIRACFYISLICCTFIT